MASYRYVGGGKAQILGQNAIEFTTYGQLVELPGDIADLCILGHIPILPVEEFDQIGHTDEELSKFSQLHTHANAPAEFLEKRKKAWAAHQAKHQLAKEGV